MADRYPLIVASGAVQELPSGDNLDLTLSGIANATGIGASNVNVSGIVTVGQKIQVGGGSTALPSITATDTDTGIFFPSNDTVVISCGGSERIRFTTAGISTQGPASPDLYPVIAIDAPDLKRYDSLENTDDYPLISVNYGVGVGNTYGRMQSDFGTAAQISHLTIPVMNQNVFYTLCRNDVAGFRGSIDVTFTDAVGGATTNVRHGILGNYGNSTGFVTTAKSVNGSSGGDLGVGFTSINLTTLGISTNAGLALGFRWTSITGIATTKLRADVTFIGYNAFLKQFKSGTATTA